jgi:hypothetical protein
MFMTDLKPSNVSKLRKLQSALRETCNFNLDFAKLTADRAVYMIESSKMQLEAARTPGVRLKHVLIIDAIETWQAAINEAIDNEDVEEAKVILAAREISRKLRGLTEDVAKLQVQDLIPIIDAMKTEVGIEKATVFNDSVDEVLTVLVDTLKDSKDKFDNALAIVQGLAPETNIDGIGGDDDADITTDEFGGNEFGDNAPQGRSLKPES